MIEFSDLVQAYFDCRKNKRNTSSALKFEIDYERLLIDLWNDINGGTYELKRSVAFIVNKPVKREIFAGDFRDRIVHHLIINKLNNLFEKEFIYDSYSCRVGRGTHFGIKRVDGFIKKCSKNYTKDCYILQMDITGFFMGINKEILFNKLHNFINKKYDGNDKEILIELIKKVVFNETTKNCLLKGDKNDWSDLPKNKSLFHSRKNCGLPIGNLTSQIFANYYLSEFDHFIKSRVGVRYYGRYVDDFVIVHHNKNFLKELICLIKKYLNENLELKIHPKKTYLQHYINGVKFLGVIIKPNRIYIGNRLKSNFFNAFKKQNKFIYENNPTDDDKLNFLSSINSYLGLIKNYNSYNFKKNIIINNISLLWLDHFKLFKNCNKFVKR